MKTDEKFSYAENIYHDAEALINEGGSANQQKANELMEKAKGLLDEAEAEAQTQNDLSSLKERVTAPVNQLPVSAEDQKAWSENEVRMDGSIGNQKISNSFRPAGYDKSLPAAAQLPWIKSAFGESLKQEAAAYEKAFETWVRAKTETQFYKTAENWEVKALSEGSDGAGGYTVPTLVEDTVVNSGPFGDQIRPRVRQYNVGSDAGVIPVSTGVSVAAISEAGAITGAESDPTFSSAPYTIEKVGALTRVSDELLADSTTNIPSLLNDLFGTAFGQYYDKAIINAILAAGTDHRMSAATSVSSSDLTGIFYDLGSQHRGANAHFIMTSPIGALVAAINASSAGQHVAQDLTTSPAATLLGKPVIYDDNSSNLATSIIANNEIAIFGDLNQFANVNRSGKVMKKLSELYAGNGQTGYVVTERSDQIVLIATAFEILKAAAS